ncbi:hypothetical protein CDL15_Pgr021604 [Punica granatum]|uniref:WRKY domain-containing protein n=1 Tax=Punica granatum TaxID=22663 RepID=A0A218WSV0_PUNGR|nr:hypothetical protein CDL15_Pgr021604 [Punica granatum]
MVPCTEGSPSSSDPKTQAVTVTPVEGAAAEKPHREIKQMSPDSRAHPSQSDPEGANSCTAPPKTSGGSDRDSCLVQSVQEGKSASINFERVLFPSPKGALSSPPTHGGSASSGKAEKASEDGYNWRKYGQKNVKGNEFIRSYYKCTHPNCLVKKQVERSLEGQITDTVYFGQHEHPKPNINIPLAVGLVVSIVEEKPEKPSSTVTEEKPSEVGGKTCHQVKTTDTPLSPTVTASNDVRSAALSSPRSRLRDEFDNDDGPSSKRKKKENRGVEAAAVDKATGDTRLIIQTTSEVDIVNDGYRWRKYGQKLVKGNPNPSGAESCKTSPRLVLHKFLVCCIWIDFILSQSMSSLSYDFYVELRWVTSLCHCRSYYRCSSPGCPVKKHVERASHDPKVVMTTYEGQHDHDMPAARMVTRNPAGTNGATIAQNDEGRIKSGEGEAVSADAAVREGNSDPPSKSTEQQTDKSENKCGRARSLNAEGENKSNERQEVEPSSHCESQERGSPTDAVLPRGLIEEQPNSQLAAKPEESEGICHNKVGKKSNEQQQVLNTAAAVQS